MVDKKRILYLSRLKSLACIAIVLLHTITASLTFAKGQSDTMKVALLSLRNLTMWAVPCFIMATGALLLDEKKELGIKKLFLKLIPRMAAALVVFTFLFACFDAALVDKSFDISKILSFTADSIIYNKSWSHMWYLYLMIAIYLMMPAYRAVTMCKDKNLVIYIICIMFVFLSIVPMIQTAVSGGDQNAEEIRFVIYVSKIFPMYLFAGYAVNKKILKMPLIISIAGIIVCGAAEVLLTSKAFNTRNAVLLDILTNYSFPVIVIGSVCIFSLMSKTESFSLGIGDKIFAQIEKCSFGVYLLHMAVIRYVFVVIEFDPFEHGGLITIFGITVGAFLISFAVVRVLKFVPVVNKLI